MSTPTRVVEVGVHPSNGLALREPVTTCASCEHHDPVLLRCLASRDAPTAAGSWPACIRYIRASHLGRLIASAKRRPEPWAYTAVGLAVSWVFIMAVHLT